MLFPECHCGVEAIAENVRFFEYAWHMDKNSRLKTLRIILAVLAIIPIALIIYNLIFMNNYYGGDSMAEMAYTVFGIPILIFNLWAWYYPKMVAYILWGEKSDEE